MYMRGYKLMPELAAILEKLTQRGYDIQPTDLGRSFVEHIEIYKRIAARNNKEFNIDDVPLGSRHLPCWETPDLRAIDFKAQKDGAAVPGIVLYENIQELKGDTYTGCGVGKFFVHLDTDRTRDAVWYYNY